MIFSLESGAGLNTFTHKNQATGRRTTVSGMPIIIHLTKGMVIPAYFSSMEMASILIEDPAGVIMPPIILATGRAIITTDVPGCRETVQDGVNGFLVPVRDAQTLADRMIQLAADPALRQSMGDASYQICLERFEAGKVNDAMYHAMLAAFEN